MKFPKAALLSLLAMTVANAHAENDNQTLLNSFHKYGITKCDQFIIEHSKLNGNWNYFINKHSGGIDGPTTEVSVIRIWGSENDTVKVDDSYIQTPKNCYVHTRSTVTFPGSCESNVDGNLWYVSNRMPRKDYTTYTNQGGVDMQAKEIQVGNFKACILETAKRKKGRQG